MKLKIKKSKFIRNIFIGIIGLIMVALIINYAPGYKRDKYKNVINLVIGDTNVTDELKKEIYKDEKGAIYIAKEDIQSFLDKTIYYDEKEHLIITTSEVSVGGMKVGDYILSINGNTIKTLSTIIINNNTIYIPINEFKTVYNIDIKYIEDTNTLIIDKLNEGMIKAQADQDTIIRYKQRSLSKVVGQLKEGEVVSAFYTTSKGWRMIRTEEGLVGYVKANTLRNEYILRQDMNQTPETKEITINLADNNQLQIADTTVIIKDLFKLTNEGILLKNTDFINSNSNCEIWANVSIGDIELEKFENRTKIIKNVLSISIRNNIKGINIIATDNNQDLKRFIIELTPILREVGIKTNIVQNSYLSNIDLNINEGIVDYIITEK